MQGLWKEKLGGYNHKGERRKTQTRRNSFKDKAKGVYTRCYKLHPQKDIFLVYNLGTNGVEELKGIYGVRVESSREWSIISPESRGLRKNLQRIANKATRAKVKNWLAKKDYEQNSDPKFTALDKTIKAELMYVC